MLTRRSFIAASTAAAVRPADVPRPNLVFILTDDQRWDMTSYAGHPFLKTPNLDRLRREGVLLANAFVTTSLCSPSRANFLTGTYAHTNGVLDNRGKEFDPHKTPSFAQLLQKAGYETAYIGKWHQARHADPRPGFDHWLSFRGQGVYTDPELNENGREFQAKGYMTDILTDAAVQFVNKERSKPFCLVLAHKAIHGPFTPAERHKDLFTGVNLPEPPNYNDDLASKPAWQRRKGGLDTPPARIEPPRWNPAKGDDYLNYYRALLAVDEGVGRLYDALRSKGILDNTVLVFGSDNGYFKGEHGGLGDKRLAYEEALRIPFLLRYPKLARPNSTVREMVLNIDLAPTFLQLGGAPVPQHMQGMSLVPLLSGAKTKWRESFLYEYFLDLQPRLPRMVGVRTRDAKLVRYPDIEDIPEMYDLKADPLEMRNVALDPRYAARRKALEAELDRLMKETDYPSGPFETSLPPPDTAKPKPRRSAR
jgi:arylsulfatase A-like enzyme